MGYQDIDLKNRFAEVQKQLYGQSYIRYIKGSNEFAVRNDESSLIVDRGNAKVKNCGPKYTGWSWGGMNVAKTEKCKRLLNMGVIIRNEGAKLGYKSTPANIGGRAPSASSSNQPPLPQLTQQTASVLEALVSELPEGVDRGPWPKLRARPKPMLPEALLSEPTESVDQGPCPKLRPTPAISSSAISSTSAAVPRRRKKVTFAIPEIQFRTGTFGVKLLAGEAWNKSIAASNRWYNKAFERGVGEG